MKKGSQEECISRLENCIRETSEWMTNSLLKLNEETSEFILFGTQQQLQKVKSITIKVGTFKIEPDKSVRNLGYYGQLHENAYHINRICAQLYGTLKKNAPNQILSR